MTQWRSAAARRIMELTRTKNVRAAAVELGRRLTDGQLLPPTNLMQILARVDIHSCYPVENLMIAGELRKSDEGFEIAYAASDGETRRRFTIAHEIAHAVFERTGPRCPRRGRELERLCDMIASQILIPQAILDSEVRIPVDLKEVRRLAKRFNTSITMTALRCADQFPIVCAQAERGDVVWQSGGHKFRIPRPEVILKQHLSLVQDMEFGAESCLIALNKYSTIEANLEWLRTGEERYLLVLTRRERE